MGKTINIEPITRIEGHARVKIEVNDQNQVEFACLYVNELRGFEKILEGMKVEEMPLITGRICGVCPAAHHLAAVNTLDRSYGTDVPVAAHMIRELMYLGHMIHSHALSLFLLSGPDLVMGLDSDPLKRNIVGMLEKDPDLTKRALRLRSIGQMLLEKLGGRGIHPVTAIPGGVTFSPSESQISSLLKDAEEGLKLAVYLVNVIKKLLSEFLKSNSGLIQSIKEKTHYMGTVKDGKLNFYEGLIRVMDPKGSIHSEFDSKDYHQHIVEKTVDWNYLKPTYLKGKNGEPDLTYRVGSLARINVADAMETPLAQKELEIFRKNFGRPCHHTLMFHYARAIELLYSCEKAVTMLKDGALKGTHRVQVETKPANAAGHIEAPRGTLIHDYEVSDEGLVDRANLIIATQQNFVSINNSIKQCAEHYLNKSEDDFLNSIEFSIRTYDPCLSCATHETGRIPLAVDIYHQGNKIKKIRRF